MLAPDETLKILLTSSLALMAMLIAIIAFLTSRYEEIKEAPSWIYEPYRRLAQGMIVILILAAVTSLLNLAYLEGIIMVDSVFALQIISTLFVLQILGIVASGVIIAFKFLRKTK